MKFINEFKESIKKFKNNFKNTLMFELIYNAISIGILYLLSKLIFNFTLNVTGIKYLSNSTFFTWLRSPLTIIALFIAYFCWLFLATIEVTAMIRNYYSRHKLSCFNMIYLGIKDALQVFKTKSWRLIWYMTIIVLSTCSIGVFNLFKSVYIPEYIETFVTTRMFLLFILILGIITLFIYSIKWTYILYYFLIKKNDLKTATLNYKKKMQKQLVHTLGGRILFSLIFLFFLAIIIIILCSIPIIICRLFFNNNIGYEFSLNICYWVPIIILFIFQIIIVPLEFAYMSVVFNNHNVIPFFNLVNVRENRNNKKAIRQTLIIILSLLLNMIIIYSTNMEKYQMMRKTSYIPEITAHRGSSIVAPENTIPAFVQAINDNADWIELDVHETKDGVLVITHDANIKRITGKKVYVYDLTYEELEKYSIGSWINMNYQDVKIPTLEEVLQLCQGKVKLNIELKPTGHEKDFANKVINMIKKYNLQDNSYLASGKEYILKEIKTIDPNIKTIYDMMVAEGDITKFDFADVYSIEQSYISSNIIKRVHNAGKSIYAWTVNDPDAMHKLADMGIDNIVTDNPALAKKILVNDRLKEKYRFLKNIFNIEVLS